MDRRRYLLAVPTAALCCVAACTSPPAHPTSASPSAQAPASAPAAPPPPVLSFGTLSAEMLTAKDESRGWKAGAQRSGKLAGALDNPCFTGSHVTPPGHPRLRAVTLTSPESHAKIVTTIDQTLLVYPSAADAISAVASLRTKFVACPPTKFFLPSLSNTSVTPAHEISTKVTTTSIERWQGFVAAHAYILTGYGNSVGIANRTALLTYSNAVVVISLDADVTHFTTKAPPIPSFDKTDSTGLPYWQRLVAPFFIRTTRGA